MLSIPGGRDIKGNPGSNSIILHCFVVTTRSGLGRPWKKIAILRASVLLFASCSRRNASCSRPLNRDAFLSDLHLQQRVDNSEVAAIRQAFAQQPGGLNEAAYWSMTRELAAIIPGAVTLRFRTTVEFGFGR